MQSLSSLGQFGMLASKVKKQTDNDDDDWDCLDLTEENKMLGYTNCRFFGTPPLVDLIFYNLLTFSYILVQNSAFL